MAGTVRSRGCRLISNKEKFPGLGLERIGELGVLKNIERSWRNSDKSPESGKRFKQGQNPAETIELAIELETLAIELAILQVTASRLIHLLMRIFFENHGLLPFLARALYLDVVSKKLNKSYFCKKHELVAQSPWKDEEESTSGSEEYGTPDEHGTPSFEEWVPLSSQQEVEENKRVGDNFKTLLTDLEEEIPEDLNEKLKELGKVNEELQNRINDYVHKLQLADDKIKQLEMEKRAQDSLNKALKRKLKKAKSSANGPPEQKRQFGGEEYGCQGDEQTKRNVR
uniref:uncharacterized protein LOC105351279 n=1 Tax=Fragaria vesca subsp. vesca TaxID=101020 RepID=UPI0005C8BF2B|nr:PREDICTED: uncharacterized protein LOC105351279 [Fragaria vesca subsp. vesca]